VKNTDYVGALFGLKGVCNLAATSDGDLFTSELGMESIELYGASQFNTTGAFAEASATIQGNDTIAVDLSNDEAFIDQGSDVLIYDASTALLEKIKPSEEASGAFGGSKAIAVNSVTHEVYVADGEHSRISVFSAPLVVPDVTTEAPGLTTTTATLKGVVDPDGIQASCIFEYGTSESYGQTAPCSSAPGAGSTPVQVTSAEITGLEPAVLYHYRVVATNANGTSTGEDHTFALPFKPVVSDVWATEVELSTAIVEAGVDPMSYDTSFRVEYGTSTAYGSTMPVPDADIGSDAQAKTVRQRLTGLQPGTTYHYRVVATNANGETDGADRTFTTFAAASGEQEICPNAVLRTGFSAALPDCRAYEMVTPVEKNGADVFASYPHMFVASSSGDRIQYPTRTGFGETNGSGYLGTSQYIASRGSGGWSSKGITPTPAANDTLQLFFGSTYIFDFSEELDRAVLLGYDLPVEGTKIESEDLYLENTETSKLLATVTSDRNEGEALNMSALLLQPKIGGSSSDMEVVTFETIRNLVPEATGSGPKVYAFEHGSVKLVGVLPDGSIPSGGSSLARKEFNSLVYKDTVSRDGSRVLFMSPASGERQLYMRKSGSATVLVSQSEASAPTAAQNVQFQGATRDDKKVLFTTESRLLDTDPGGPGEALYMYTDSPNPETESNLTFISRGIAANGSEGEVVKGISEDGSHIYYMDNGALFLWDEGQIQQVAPEPGAPGAVQAGGQARVSDDGKMIAFMSGGESLTRGNDIRDLPLEGGIPNTEIYVYDEISGKLVCASCPQNGTAVTSGVELDVQATTPSVGFETHAQTRFFSDDGRFVFFNTREALVAGDTNGVSDAYEYDTQTGKLSLLSTGEGEDGTWFVEASANGQDVFLVTRQRLSKSDPDDQVDLYDARVDGGLPEPPEAQPPCQGDACQGTPSAAPSFNTASEFEGQGNPSFASTTTPKAKGKAKALTAAQQRLKRALAPCRKKKAKHSRALCEARVRKRNRAAKSVRHTNRAER
jgi:hypothetical protein